MNAAAVLPDAARLLGRMGLIRGVRTILHAAGEPRLFNVNAMIAETQRYTGQPADHETGSIGFSYQQAAAGAIGELVERYCCSVLDPSALVYASQQELGEPAIGMDRFAIHSDEEYARPRWPLARQQPDRPINWVEARSLVDGRVRYVPACLVYIPYPARERSDLVALGVSSGNAAHTDRTRALLTGLYEVVERDAFMISWLRMLRLPRVDFLADPELAAVHARHFAAPNLTYHIFDLTLDIAIPTYLCITEVLSRRGTFVCMGAATRFSPREAITKAMLEAAQCIVWCRDLLKRRPDYRPQPDWSDIRTFEDRVRLYCEPDMREHLRFWLDTPRRAPLPPEPAPADPEQILRDCVDRVSACGLETVVADQTAPDVARAGFHAVKVMIPGTVPLTALHAIPANGSPRLWTVPAALGHDGDACPGLNPIPHLFP